MRYNAFMHSTYADQYDDPAEIRTNIIRNNAKACDHVLKNPSKFPKADFNQLKLDYSFLIRECEIRGVTPAFTQAMNGLFAAEE